MRIKNSLLQEIINNFDDERNSVFKIALDLRDARKEIAKLNKILNKVIKRGRRNSI